MSAKSIGKKFKKSKKNIKTKSRPFEVFGFILKPKKNIKNHLFHPCYVHSWRRAMLCHDPRIVIPKVVVMVINMVSLRWLCQENPLMGKMTHRRVNTLRWKISSPCLLSFHSFQWGQGLVGVDPEGWDYTYSGFEETPSDTLCTDR